MCLVNNWTKNRNGTCLSGTKFILEGDKAWNKEIIVSYWRRNVSYLISYSLRVLFALSKFKHKNLVHIWERGRESPKQNMFVDMLNKLLLTLPQLVKKEKEKYIYIYFFKTLIQTI